MEFPYQTAKCQLTTADCLLSTAYCQDLKPRHVAQQMTKCLMPALIKSMTFSAHAQKYFGILYLAVSSSSWQYLVSNLQLTVGCRVWNSIIMRRSRIP